MVKQRLKVKHSHQLKHDASAQNVYDVAEALMELQEY